MNLVEETAPSITEPLTWAEICERYPDEWVCLVELEFEAPGAVMVKSGRVVGHGKTRREPVEQAGPWWSQYKLMGHYFTGRVTVRPLRPQVTLDDETRDFFRYRR